MTFFVNKINSVSKEAWFGQLSDSTFHIQEESARPQTGQEESGQGVQLCEPYRQCCNIKSDQ